MILNFGLESYQHTSRPISAQRMLNCYLEPGPPASKTKAAVVQSFGISDFLTLDTLGTGRGACVVNNVIYAVAGTGMYQVATDGSVTLLGSIPGFGPVCMAADGKNVMVTANGPAYVYDGTTVQQITDPSFPGAEWVTFLDGYMVVGPGDGRVYVNQTPYVPLVWNALDFASAEAAPDDIVVGIVDHRELALFGRETTEFWYDSGAADFPLARTASGFMEVGCTSKYGPVKINNSIYFPANDGTIRRVDGYTPVRISHYAVEQAIQRYASQDCIGMAWVEYGHSMIAFTYAEGTWVFDISTQLWHERQSYGLANWRPRTMVRANNQTYALDSTTGKLGKLDPDTFTEWSGPLISSVTSPAVADKNHYIQHGVLELIFESGTGTISGQGADPQVMLQWSDDSARNNWSNEVWRSMGKMGETQRQVQFYRLGQAFDRTYRITMSDPVRRTLVQALLNER